MDTPTSLGARLQRLSSERARKLEELRKLEWEFAHDPTMDMLGRLTEARAYLELREEQIVITSALVRSMQAIQAVA